MVKETIRELKIFFNILENFSAKFRVTFEEALRNFKEIFAKKLNKR